MDALDVQVLTGDGTGNNFSGFTTELPAAAAAGDAIDEYGDIIAHALGGVDGKYSNNLTQVRLLLGLESYRLAGKLFSSAGDSSSADYLLARSGGVRASANMPAVSSNTQVGLLSRSQTSGRAVLPIWGPGPRLIRDEFSLAASGQVALSLITLAAFKIVDEGPWMQFSIRTAV